jgi:aminopeptidase N
VTLRFAAPLAKGRYVIDLPYRSRIVREPDGVFALEDASPLTLTRALCTRLSPSNARYLMPLWDESRFAATFEVTAIVAAGDAAASNRPLASRRVLDDGRIEFHFLPARALRPADLFLTAGDPGVLCTRVGAPRPALRGHEGI